MRMSSFDTAKPIPPEWRISGSIPQQALAVKLLDGSYAAYVQKYGDPCYIEYVEYDVDGQISQSTFVGYSNGHFATCESGSNTPPVVFDHDGEVFYWEVGLEDPVQFPTSGVVLGLAIATDREGMPMVFVQSEQGLTVAIWNEQLGLLATDYQTGPYGDSIATLSSEGAFLVAAFLNSSESEFGRSFITLMFLRPSGDYAWQWCGVNLNAFDRTPVNEEEAYVSVVMVSMEDTTPVKPPDRDVYVGDEYYPADYPMKWEDGIFSGSGFRLADAGSTDTIECWLPDMVSGTGTAVGGGISFPKSLEVPVINEFIFDVRIGDPGDYLRITYGSVVIDLVHILSYPPPMYQPYHEFSIRIGGVEKSTVNANAYIGADKALKVRVEVTTTDVTATVYTASTTDTPYSASGTAAVALSSPSLSINQSNLLTCKLFCVGTILDDGWSWSRDMELPVEGYQAAVTEYVGDSEFGASVDGTTLSMSVGYQHDEGHKTTFQRAYNSSPAYYFTVDYYNTKGIGANHAAVDLDGGGGTPYMQDHGDVTLHLGATGTDSESHVYLPYGVITAQEYMSTATAIESRMHSRVCDTLDGWTTSNASVVDGMWKFDAGTNGSITYDEKITYNHTVRIPFYMEASAYSQSVEIKLIDQSGWHLRAVCIIASYSGAYNAGYGQLYFSRYISGSGTTYNASSYRYYRSGNSGGIGTTPDRLTLSITPTHFSGWLYSGYDGYIASFENWTHTLSGTLTLSIIRAGTGTTAACIIPRIGSTTAPGFSGMFTKDLSSRFFQLHSVSGAPAWLTPSVGVVDGTASIGLSHTAQVASTEYGASVYTDNGDVGPINARFTFDQREWPVVKADSAGVTVSMEEMIVT